MSKIVVAKLVRLAKDGDHYNKELVAKVMRTSAKVDDDFVKEFNKTWKTSGQLYIVDEDKTKQRDEKLNGKNENNDREELKSQADELGISYPKNIKTENLKQKIEDHLNS